MTRISQAEPYPVDHWPPDQFHPVYASFRAWLDEAAPTADRRLRTRRKRPQAHADRQ